MSELAELFSLHREVSQAKRAYNREQGPLILKQHGITFESKNDGAHLVVTHNGHVVSYWPGTGKYLFRGADRKGRGVFNLLRSLGVKVKR